ncbi:MAG: hypothetical protein QGH20_04530 [Candidatus Latescibacteria bacterium]|nr:hypothetical protein [Candidatus Latescibacterota bacterium]
MVGIRSIIDEGTVIKRTVMLGTDYYLWDLPDDASRENCPHLGVGEDCQIENAIIDKNACIGDGCRIVNEKGIQEEVSDLYEIHEGVTIIPRNAVLPPGTVI